MGKRKDVPCLEFKSQDGAWYEVSLKLENDHLKVHYEADLPEEVADEELSLENVDDLQDLKIKFRLPSRQLMDRDCKKVTPGTVVCAFRSDMDKRTFDARVEKVSWSKHIIVDGEEQCNCTYEVLWLAGPYELEKTTIYCENICLLQFKSIQSHPVIKEVVKYLQNKKDNKSQFAVENSSQERIKNAEKIMDRGGHWPVGDGHLTNIKELRELNLKPTTSMKMESVEKSFNYKLNGKDNNLQQLYSNDIKPRNLVQTMIYNIPEKSVLNGADTNSNNLCSPKQENWGSISAACKLEGYGSERGSLAHIPFGIGDAKDNCFLKNHFESFVEGYSGGWIDDDESPRSGKDYGGNIVGKSDDGNKAFSEDCSERLDNSKKSSSLAKFDNENGDMQSNDNATECLSSRKEGTNWYVDRNVGIMKPCTVYSDDRSREPKVTNNELASDGYIRSCGQNIECKQPLDGLKTPRLTPNKRKDILSSDSSDCEDATFNREEDSGTGAHLWMPCLMWDHQGKRPKCDKSRLVKTVVEGNISCEKELGDPTGKNSDVKKQNYQSSRSGRFDRNGIFQPYGAPVEADNIIDNKASEPTPKSCCGHRVDCSEDHPSKHIATEDLPHMQGQDAHDSPSRLNDFSTNLLHNGNICHCHFCSKNCPCCTHFRLHHDFCAECGMCAYSLVGKAHHCCSQAMCTGCVSVHKETAAISPDCIRDGNDCLASLQDELTDYKEQSKPSNTKNLNVATFQSLESSQKPNLGGTAVISNKAKCNSLERAAGQISMDAGHRPRSEKKLKDRRNIFSSSHVILLENLEKDVTPSDVLGVIRQAGVDFVKVYISPPQIFEKFTSGIVCFEDQESFQRVSAYVRNENIIIASSKGRPWVVIDTDNGLSSGSYGGFTMGHKCCGSSSNKIQIFKRGTPEYERAEKLRGQFLEWWEDFKLLHKALAYEESAV